MNKNNLKTIHMSRNNLNIGYIILAFTLVLFSGFAQLIFTDSVKAACTALPTSRGQAVSNINVTTAGTYKVWSRIMAPDTTNNSYQLQIDQTLCNVIVGDNSSIAANTWTWVDYQAGTTTNKITVSLTAGPHTVTMAGNEDNVLLDRIILTTDMACVPTGTGDNCATISTANSSDINNDGVVNIYDLSTMLSKWNTADMLSDVNTDGIVNIFDLSVLLSNWSAN